MRRIAFVLAAVAGLVPSLASAATVTLPNSGETSTMTATVREQCQITVPAAIAFDVSDVSSTTGSGALSVTVEKIKLADTKKLRVSLQANAATFTGPTGTTITYDAANVSWNAATWTTGTGSTGTLSNTAFNTLVESTANADTCSTSGLVFTLGTKDTVDRAGAYTLVVTWKAESF